jgi:hypothetical protein
MNRLIQKIDSNVIKDSVLTILIIITMICISVIANDMHQQSILDRQFGELLIKEKLFQLQVSEDRCGH